MISDCRLQMKRKTSSNLQSEIYNLKSVSSPRLASLAGQPRRLSLRDSFGPYVIGLQVQSLQIFAEGAAKIITLQGEFYRGFQESQLVAGVVAAAFVDVGVHFLLLQ